MIRTKPMNHQIEVVNFAKGKDFVGIFSDYGTGKTLIALLITEIKKYRKVLVVSTKLSIDTTWRDEIRKHTDFRFCVLQGTAQQKINILEYALGKINYPDRYGYEHDGNLKPTVFLINYEGVKSIYVELVRVGFDAVFADESTKIKTFDTERTKALYEVGETAKHRYIMTGFPITEALSELYSQIKFIDRGKTFGNSYWSFLNKYFVRQGPKTLIKKKSVKQILKAIKPFCIRITNETLNLPPKRYKEVLLDMTDQQRELLTTLNNTFQLELGKVKIDTQYVFALLSKSLQICDGFVQHIDKEEDGKIIESNLEAVETNKDEALIEVLDEIDIRQNKVVIWAAFLFSVRKIQTILTKLKVPVLTLTGENENTNKTVELFQNTKGYNVLVCTQKKAAESVTLTAAKYAIYYSNTWSNDQRLNSEARIRRKGSEKHDSIMYIDLVTKGSVEKKVVDCLKKKKNLVDELKTSFLEMRREL